MKTQKQQILEALAKGEKLSKVKMLNCFGCWNSGEVIRRLRNEGHNIMTRFDKCKNKRGKYAVYFMPEAQF